MDKTTYMHTLQAALEGLPASTIERVLWAYEARFAEAARAGLSEQACARSLPAPRWVGIRTRLAERCRVAWRYFSLNNALNLCVAGLGLALIDLFMLIPWLLSAGMLVGAYISSIALYAAGILSCAFVLSGVTEFSFDVPAVHEPLASQMQHREEAVHLRFGTQGVIGDDATDDRMEATFGQSPEVLHVLVSRDEGAPLLLSGLAMLFAGLLGFLLTLWLTRLSLRGSWAYLRWNLGRLRAALEPATAAS